MNKMIVSAIIVLLTTGIVADEIKLKYSSVTGEDVTMVREYMEFFGKAMNEIHNQWEHGEKPSDAVRRYLDNLDDLTIKKMILYDIKIRYTHKRFLAELDYINSYLMGASRPNLYAVDELEELMLSPGSVYEEYINGKRRLNIIPSLTSLRRNIWSEFLKTHEEFFILSETQRFDYWAVAKLMDYTESEQYKRTLHAVFQVIETPFNLPENSDFKIEIIMQNDLRNYDIGKTYLINFEYSFIKTNDPVQNEKSVVYINDSYTSNSTAIYDISDGKPKSIPFVYTEGTYIVTTGSRPREYASEYSSYKEMFASMRKLVSDLEIDVNASIQE